MTKEERIEKMREFFKNRPKPSVPRAGFLASRRRYAEGGKIEKDVTEKPVEKPAPKKKPAKKKAA